MIPFRDAGWTVAGVDPDIAAVDYGRDQLGLPVSQAFAEKLPFPDGEADVVLCLGTVEHVHDVSAALSELHRVLKPDGLLLVRYRGPMWGSPYEYYNHNHYRYFSDQTIKLFMAKFGFLITEIKKQAIEDMTGAYYMVATRQIPLSPDQVLGVMSSGLRDDPQQIVASLSQYTKEFARRSEAFIALADANNRDPQKVADAVHRGEIHYSIFEDVPPEESVPRAIAEAERFLAALAAG